jgi:hypothetical protein
MKNRIVGIHQPNFMPWMGFFNKIYRSDIFVLIDDVQFAKGSVCNRTKLKNNEGKEVWLTVPVRFDNGSASTFNQTKIADSQWHKKALNLIKSCYIQAPYYKQYLPELENIFVDDHPSLASLNCALIKYFCRKFGIATPIHLQSELSMDFGKKNFLNLGITRHFNGNIYLSGTGAKKYNDHKLFEENNVTIQYLNYEQPQYRQLYGNFIEGLSVVDLLFNEGEAGSAFIKLNQKD